VSPYSLLPDALTIGIVQAFATHLHRDSLTEHRHLELTIEFAIPRVIGPHYRRYMVVDISYHRLRRK